MKTHALKEQRAAKIAEMRTLNEKAANDNRDLNDAERTQFEALDKEVRGLGEQIDRAEKLDAYDRLEANGDVVSGPDMRRELRNYSLAKAVNESQTGRLTGLEAEVHAELSRGREARGLMVPTEILLGRIETRAVLTSGSGGDMVRTDLAAMTDRRRPALKVQALGATVLQGLVGNLDLPRLAGSGAAHWVAENGATTGSDVTFDKKSMGPKTVSAQYELSRRMRLQSNQAIEDILRNDLGLLLAQALDAAAIKGGGTNEPVGILADTNVAHLTAATISSDATADLIAALDTDDVTGTRAFLTHPRVIQLARKLKDKEDLPIPLTTTFGGERVETSTQVPVVTAASGQTPATRALIYGEWASLYIGYWSGVDILVNPYADAVASKGGALLHAFLDADVIARHPEGFRWMEVSNPS